MLEDSRNAAVSKTGRVKVLTYIVKKGPLCTPPIALQMNVSIYGKNKCWELALRLEKESVKDKLPQCLEP
ncbi:hypothetical protein STEG23_035862 [Scotinomys teguina]